MADKDQDGPSLEMPSLGFGRRKKGKKATVEAPVETPTAESTPAEESTAVMEPVAATPRAPTPARAAPAPAPAPERPLFADEAPSSVEPAVKTEPVATPEPESQPIGGERKAPKEKREFTLPDIGGVPASMITGLLVGAIMVGLTWAGFRLCEVVQGTQACGNPGFLLLVAIVVAMVWLGSVLLKAWGIPDPGSTSFLGVGLLAVLALLFLVDVLFSWWMIIVIPVIAMLTYALSHWVTTAFVEPPTD